MVHCFLFLFLLICTVTDLVSRKIYNKVIIYGISAALLCNLFKYGVSDGIILTVTGTLTGIMLLIIPFLLGGLGAGDVKMLGMIGAFTGGDLVIKIMLASALIGGMYALMKMVLEGGLIRRMKKIFLAFYCFFFTKKSIHLTNLQDTREAAVALPYGAVMALGVVVIYIIGSFQFFAMRIYV